MRRRRIAGGLGKPIFGEQLMMSAKQPNRGFVTILSLCPNISMKTVNAKTPVK